MTVTSEITALQNQTAYNQLNSKTSSSSTDKDMFLSLMLQQMQNQDPTEPMDNQQWLSQLAQYSSLEQMTNMNDALTSLSSSLEELRSGISQNSSISQTLSIIGKNVDLVDPDNQNNLISGVVTEATFDDDGGQIKVNGTYYPISYVQSVRE